MAIDYRHFPTLAIPGGTTDQILVKSSDDVDNGARWVSLSELLTPVPACNVFNPAPISIPSGGGGTQVSFSSETFDTNNMHDNVTNPTRITFNTPGIYLVGGMIVFTTNSTGRRGVFMALNDTVNIDTGAYLAASAAGGTVHLATSSIVSVSAGDYAELYAYQDSGVSLNILGLGAQFYASYLGSI